MLRLTLIATILGFISCSQGEKTNSTFDQVTQTNTPSKVNKTDNALAFINGYVENSNKIKQSIDKIDWVNSNNLTTLNFKTELRKIIDDAYKKDSEMGLDSDPILNAQDYPDEGFELETFIEKSNYLIVKGKDWPEFKVTMKIVEENGNWLVDGCGIINIPNDKRAKSQ